MKTLQGLTRWLCAFLMALSLSTWIFVATTNATIGNRQTVKTWLAQSGIYSNLLTNALQINATGSSDIITSVALQKALAQTFPPSYLQQSTETVIDATYDWLGGKTSAITFTIPVQAKAADFRANLAGQLEPIIAALPACQQRYVPSSTTITCVPAGVSPKDYANQLVQPATNSQFLTEPLTQNSFGQSGVPQAYYLPRAYQWMQTLIWLLPVVWLVLGAGYVLLTPDKLWAVRRLGRQTAITSGIALVGGLFLWWMGSGFDFSSLTAGNTQSDAVMNSVAVPLVRTILPDVGRALSIFSGAAFVVGFGAWLAVFMVHRKSKPIVPVEPSAPSAPGSLPAVQKPAISATPSVEKTDTPKE